MNLIKLNTIKGGKIIPNKYHSNDQVLQDKIRTILSLNGLDVDKQGNLFYREVSMSLYVNALYLMRHAETIGTQTRKFMSDTSSNSHICKKGKLDIISLNNNVDMYNFDCVIICCNIPQVLETAEEFKKLHPNLKYIYSDKFSGINNSGWEEKSPSDLKEMDFEDYKERELKKNIFAKSSSGCSWGEVLLRSIDLINYINKYYAHQRLLLISQGSILQGIKLLIHATTVPWEDYDSKRMYNFDSQQKTNNYGKIICIYDNNKYLKKG